ncbi:PriCT-2 domain-containing protein [Leptolyngbya sp. GGD]|uniref:PriCT-2 domain-containing protein n=1 Tax=Leptolyngbya sp. GGD TaxID=2997907 RepID=UPI00227B036A|nr:PriCT-2 domain-containing protein [Leptolyngbya sp. GGD]MCY6492331.1 PriCT-2 domain-containing protein [Leptolyngbya sp. GGD]
MVVSKGFGKTQVETIGGSARTKTELSYKIGINAKIVGKTSPEQLSYAGAFIPKYLTLRELSIHCGQKGHPWMPSVLDKGARRFQHHANFAEMLVLDVDGGMSIEEAKQHPLISKWCGLGIETASSTPVLNKYRAVFPFHPKQPALTDWRTIKICTLYLQNSIQVADKACKDASRFYFGAVGREPFILNESASLPESFVNDALVWHSEQERIAEEQYREACRKSEERRRQYGKQSEQERFSLVEQALAAIPPRQTGSGNYDEWMRILAALVHEFGEADAIALVERFSPTIKGTTWDVPRKARSFRKGAARPATLGTVFRIAKEYGFRFPQAKSKFFEIGERDRELAKLNELSIELGDLIDRISTQKHIVSQLCSVAQADPGELIEVEEGNPVPRNSCIFALESLQLADLEHQRSRLESKLSCDVAEQIERDRAEQAEEKEQQKQQGSADDRRRERYRAETERIHQELNGISVEPTLSVCGEFITPELTKLPEKSGIIVIQAGTKSGKSSVALKEFLSQHYKRHGVYGHVSAWVPRRRLAAQLGKDLGLPLHKDGITNHYTACAESIGVCNPDDWGDTPPLLFFDEPSMTFKQILEGQTTKDNQPFVLEHLRTVFKAVADLGGQIVLTEDTVTNLEIDFIRDASGLEVVEFLDFHKKPESREIQLHDRTGNVWAETKQRLEDGQNVIQGSDVRRELERVEKLVLSMEIPKDKVFLFTAQTAHEPYFDEFINNRAEFINKYKPRYIGFSPAIGTGVSIDDPTGHFDAMALHLTQLEPRDAIQISERLRSNAPRYGYVSESSFVDDDAYSSSRPDVIKRSLFRNRDGIAKLTNFVPHVTEKASAMGIGGEAYQTPIFDAIARLDAEKDNINTTFGWYLDFYCKYKARGNYNKGRIREGLIERWEAKGYSVSFVDTAPNKEMADLRKQFRKDLEQAEADNFAACDVSETSLSEAREILRSNNQTTPEQRLKARKRILEDKLPGCPLDDAEFVKRVIVEHHGKFLKATELFWMAQNPEIAKHLDRWNWENQFSQAGQDRKFVILHKLSIRSGQAKLLNECPLKPFIDGEIDHYTNDSSEAIAVKDWALFHARQFDRYLRLKIKPEHSPVKVVNKILRKLGFDPQSIKRPGGTGSRDRVWAIADEQAEIDRNLILESLQQRFNEKVQRKEQEIESWVSLSETVADMLSMTRDAIKCGTVSEVMGIFAALNERDRQEVWNRLTTQEKAILHRSRAAA